MKFRTGAEEQALRVLLSAQKYTKEEWVLCPSIDKLTTNEERTKLYQKMKHNIDGDGISDCVAARNVP